MENFVINLPPEMVLEPCDTAEFYHYQYNVCDEYEQYYPDIDDDIEYYSEEQSIQADIHYNGFVHGLRACYEALLISNHNMIELLKAHDIRITS